MFLLLWWIESKKYPNEKREAANGGKRRCNIWERAQENPVQVDKWAGEVADPDCPQFLPAAVTASGLRELQGHYIFKQRSLRSRKVMHVQFDF